jgi:hypothetical protein
MSSPSRNKPLPRRARLREGECSLSARRGPGDREEKPTPGAGVVPSASGIVRYRLAEAGWVARWSGSLRRGARGRLMGLALSGGGCLLHGPFERPRVGIKPDRTARLVHPPRGIEPGRARIGAGRRSARGTGGDGRRRGRRRDVPGRPLPLQARPRRKRRGHERGLPVARCRARARRPSGHGRCRARSGGLRGHGRCRARARRPSGHGRCRARARGLGGRGRGRCAGDEGRRREEDAKLHGRSPIEGPDRGSIMRPRCRPRDDPASVRSSLSSIAGAHSSTPVYGSPCLPAVRRGSSLIQINTDDGMGPTENREQGAGPTTVCQCRGTRSAGMAGAEAGTWRAGRLRC